MMSAADYIAINRATWNQKVGPHLESAFYNMPAFLAGKTSLNKFELELLGDVRGKKILHLQCHFGQDSISLARMGAHVTGVDLSDKAIAEAQQLAAKSGVEARFICCDIYDLPAHLDDKYDIVFSSYGTIGWLPDLDRWARLIASYLSPGGQFVFAEFHPVIWMYDNNFEKVVYSYFNTEPIIEDETGTYADRDAAIQTQTVTWNHSLSETIGSLINSSLTLLRFDEYDYSPYNIFRNAVEFEPGKFRVKDMADFLPLVYSLSMTKS